MTHVTGEVMAFPIREEFVAGSRALRSYNGDMARGWESKSVEAQIEETHSETSTNPDQAISAEERQALIRKRDLTLSRRRVLQQLESSSSARYNELLRRTLAGLDAELAALN